MESSATYGSINQEKDAEWEAIIKVASESTPLVTNAERFQEKLNHQRGQWSRLVFKWFTPILDRGNENNKLDEEDLDLVPLPVDCSTDSATIEFERAWKLEMQYNPTNPSLSKALFRAFGTDFIQAGLLKLFHDLCLFVGPQVLHSMIVYLRQPFVDGSSIWQGLLLTAAVTCSQTMMSLCLRHYFFKCYTTGLRVRSAVTVAVYKKALVLSLGERQKRSLGEITNLMSIDAQRLQDLTSYLHSIWSSPLQIVVSLYFLWRELGLSSFGGVLVIIIMIPFSKKVSEWMGSMQEKLMSAKDKRVQLNGEVLSGMKVIKFQAWEESFQKRIMALREVELRQLFRYFLGSSLSELLWFFTPLAVSVSTFSVYVWLGNKLDAASALTALALFEILRFPLFMLPYIINSIVEALVSLRRVRSFLLCEEYHPLLQGKLKGIGIELDSISAVYDIQNPHENVAEPKLKALAEKRWEKNLLLLQLNDAEEQLRKLVGGDEVSVIQKYSPDETSSINLCLRRISFDCLAGQFIAIVGGVGCGKTSLLNSILGELKVVSGRSSAKGKLAYFSQTPFIMNASLRDNIIFGHIGEPIDEDLYQRCLDCCALRHDIELLPDGDESEIGEKGITLSGGQKARVALARAVYHCADITLIDDALSAVDSHVAKHLLEKALLGELLKSNEKGCTENRCVVLVTNALQYLSHPRVDKIIVMHEGKIIEEGSFGFLLSKQDSAFARYMSAIDSTKVSGSASSNDDSSVKGNTEASHEIMTAANSKPKKVGKLMSEEIREKGHVGIDVYMEWAEAAGGLVVPVLLVISFTLVEVIAVLSNYWITYWSANGDSGPSQTFFLKVYALISLSAGLASIGRTLLVNFFSIRASRELFSLMLKVILHAKMSFFDTTPVGRLVNRFSKDIYTIDESLPETLGSYLGTLFNVLSTVAIISYVAPMFTFCLIPVILFYWTEQVFFTLTYRELKRLDSIAKSPVLALLGETVDGAAVIRAFSAQNSLLKRLISMLDKQQHAYFLTCAAQSWLGVRLELIGTLIIAFSCLSALAQHTFYATSANFAALAGLAISYALSVTQSLNWTVRMASDMEATMVSVERVREYIKIENEGDRKTPVDDILPATWPTFGEIVFQDVKLRYRPELPFVLRGMCLDIPAGSKVGVVGRTGAGKSTLMVALMRITELCEGKILIDGTDIRTIGLAKLRSSIALIPQDPVLFTGTVRTNLDPFNESGDDDLYEALEHVGLYVGTKNGNQSTPSGSHVNSLDDIVTEGGMNFSVGQRQLLVIARALLHGAKIVIMDEATASIDAETDYAIQKVFRKEFADATCITVAHRLNTVMDSDYILVMEDGKAAEFDSPKKLLQKGGLFRDLVQAATFD